MATLDRIRRVANREEAQDSPPTEPLPGAEYIRQTRTGAELLCVDATGTRAFSKGCVDAESDRVLESYVIKARGPAIVLNQRAKRGDIVVQGERRWRIAAIETFCIANPPLPWGFHLEGFDAPAIGSQVVLEKGPNHDVTRFPNEG